MRPAAAGLALALALAGCASIEVYDPISGALVERRAGLGFVRIPPAGGQGLRVKIAGAGVLVGPQLRAAGAWRAEIYQIPRDCFALFVFPDGRDAARTRRLELASRGLCILEGDSK